MDVNEYMKELGVKKYHYNEKTGFVDVIGDVSLRKSYSTKKARKILVKFGKITGNFDCSFCLLLTLDGAPQSVKDFNCSHNNLKDLLCSPQVVTGNFACNSNKGISLEGAPPKVDGNFEASNCDLYDLKGLPEHIGGDADFSSNELGSISGVKVIKGNLGLSHNKLVAVSTKDKEIGGDIDVSCNPMQPDDDMEGARW